MYLIYFFWNVVAHSDTRKGKWRGNWRMDRVASTLHTTSEHVVSSITTADAHTSAVSSRLNWLPSGRIKWTRPFRRNGFCACAVTFQTQSTVHQDVTLIGRPVCRRSAPTQDDDNRRHRLSVGTTRRVSWATVSASTAETTRSPGQSSPSVRTAARGRTFTSGI